MYQFNILKGFGDRIFHHVFTRHMPVEKVSVEVKKITGAALIFFKKQLHGDTAVVLSKKPASKKVSDFEGDAFITNVPSVPLGIRIADCASILLYDSRQHAIANIHAGWRGLAKRIIRKTISEMMKRYDSRPVDMYAGISPMLGPCCSVFSDPYTELPRFLHPFITEENTVNLWAIAESQLRECGVPQAQIENPRICTYCNPEDFFSYRRGDTEKRFTTVIMLK